jgi:hypothetical protein
MGFGSPAAPEIVFRIGMSVEERIEPCAQLFLDVDLQWLTV